MELIIPNSLENLEQRLAAYDNVKPLKRFVLCKELVMSTIHEIIRKIDEEPYMHDSSTIITYNRYYLPPLYARFLYFDKCYRLENHRLSSSLARWKSIIEEELNMVDYFLGSHIEFAQYLDGDDDSRDEYLFTPQNDAPPFAGTPSVKNSKYIKPACLLAAYILANRQYAQLLQSELANTETILPNKKNGPKVEFKGTEKHQIQVARAKFAKGDYFVDGKPATMEYFIQKAREESGCKLKNWAQIASSMKWDEEEQTYLMTLNDALINHNDALIEGKRPHKTRRKNIM